MSNAESQENDMLLCWAGFYEHREQLREKGLRENFYEEKCPNILVSNLKL